MARPRLTFFCELPAAELATLFADDAIIEDLRALGAGVSLGLLDLSAERADVVRRLNAAGVPLIAWLLLPQAQGYWFNAGNAPAAVEQYEAFRVWSAAHELEWAGVGLDIEPDIRDAAVLSVRGALFSMLLRRVFDMEQLRRAQQIYAGLITQIRADGYTVDSYQLPLIVDERRAGTTLLQRLAGIVNLDVDREVLMLYSSFMRPLGPGLLWSYAGEGGSVGLGVTGGGVDLPELQRLAPLTWDELARDLRVAWQWNDDIHIFSLEGCVQQGFLSRLRAFDWAQMASRPGNAGQADRLRRMLRAVLWASRHPVWVAAGFLLFFWMLARLRRQR
jgi:hypothetical protein